MTTSNTDRFYFSIITPIIGISVAVALSMAIYDDIILNMRIVGAIMIAGAVFGWIAGSRMTGAISDRITIGVLCSLLSISISMIGSMVIINNLPTLQAVGIMVITGFVLGYIMFNKISDCLNRLCE